jgi:hypothetical protein
MTSGSGWAAVTGDTATSPWSMIPDNMVCLTSTTFQKILSTAPNNIGLGDVDWFWPRPTYLFEQGGVSIHRNVKIGLQGGQTTRCRAAKLNRVDRRMVDDQEQIA